MIVLSAPSLLHPPINPQNEKVRSVLVVGDPREWARLARTALAGDPRLEVLGVVDCAGEALALVPNLQPDVVLVEVDPPDMPAHELARRLDAMAGTGRTILTGPSDGLQSRARAHTARAAGYLAKSTLTPTRILALI